jgi:hypothetical protein
MTVIKKPVPEVAAIDVEDLRRRWRRATVHVRDRRSGLVGRLFKIHPGYVAALTSGATATFRIPFGRLEVLEDEATSPTPDAAPGRTPICVEPISKQARVVRRPGWVVASHPLPSGDRTLTVQPFDGGETWCMPSASVHRIDPPAPRSP